MKLLIIITTILFSYCLGFSQTPDLLKDQNADTNGLVSFSINFCQFKIPKSIKSASASFYVTYTFLLDTDGKPQKINKVKNEYVDEKEVTACIENWQFQNLQRKKLITISFRWEHGVGWTSLSLIGLNFRYRIDLSGEKCPYCLDERQNLKNQKN
jgi:hypothetical protein